MSNPVSEILDSVIHSTGPGVISQFKVAKCEDDNAEQKVTLNHLRRMRLTHDREQSMVVHYFLTNRHLLRALHSREVISQVKGCLYWFDADDTSRTCWRWHYTVSEGGVGCS